MEIYQVWNGKIEASGAMKEPCTGNFHTNPRLNLDYLPGLSVDTFAIAVMATESCYVFMELFDVEDGRSLDLGIPEFQAISHSA